MPDMVSVMFTPLDGRGKLMDKATPTVLETFPNVLNNDVELVETIDLE